MNKEILAEAGVHYEEGLKRFSGKAAIYEKYIGKFLADETYPNLKACMEAGDFENAFRRAHDLKGLVGNLSLDAFYEKINPLVEALRNGADIPKAQEILPECTTEYNKVMDAIRRAME